LGVGLITLSSGLWNCIKSKAFFRTILLDYDELKKFYKFLGKQKLEEESKKLNPKLGYAVNMELWIKSSTGALDQTRNGLFVIILCIIIGSYFLGHIFCLINIVLFVAMSFFPIVPSAKDNIISDVHVLMLNVYKWHKENLEECAKYCMVEQPEIFHKIYKVIIDE
jgi:hypothetical protein